MSSWAFNKPIKGNMVCILACFSIVQLSSSTHFQFIKGSGGSFWWTPVYLWEKKKKEKKRLFLQRKSCNIHGAYDLGSVANKACSLLLKDGQWSWCLRFSDHNPDVICIATAEHVQNLSKQTSSTCWHFRGSKGPFCGYFSENSRMF